MTDEWMTDGRIVTWTTPSRLTISSFITPTFILHSFLVSPSTWPEFARLSR